MTAAAISRDDGRWLMHRRPAHKHHGGLWEFPGGKVELGESPPAALVREMAEELGIEVRGELLRPLAFAQDVARGGESPIVILLYSIDQWLGEPTALEQGAIIGWFTPEEIARLHRPPLDMDLCAQIFPVVSAATG